MPVWKLNLFVRVVSRRMADENSAAEDVLAEYPALTEAEVAEIITVITQ